MLLNLKCLTLFFYCLALYAKKGSLTKKTILAIGIVSSVATILLLAFAYWLFRRKRADKARDAKNIEFSLTSSLTHFDDSISVKEPDGSRRNFDLPMFQLSTIVAATNNFSPDRKLGEGGFGSVYKIWDLWREGRSLEMVDELLGESYTVHEVLRCIQIGLLCVQEQATDRPTMSMVVSMLGNDKDLPYPKQPAFIGKRFTKTDESSGGISSLNEVTISMVHGR
ncbi:hypothetical protein Patl1_10950 [Pistacia atlantica]|uniref:Uncharacterized protein n=1 Tax=Pistacia atlantica TaxID=434234 RepID=A0ACC1AA28_9ROSI|nr:hypothetical protein Patl1_10950 [Pistacia atlantica]